MSAFLIILRMGLAAVFLTAAGAKLTDAAGTRKALAGFGVPRALADGGWLLLPAVEVAVAVLLFPATVAWWGAAAGAALLAVFTAAILLNLARGRAPECHCFGQLSAAPIGWRDIARNAVFLAAAGIVTAQGPGNAGPSAVAWLGDLTGAEAGLLAVSLVALAGVAIEGWFIFELLAQHGRLLARFDALGVSSGAGAAAGEAEPAFPPGLPVGAAAPDFRALDLERGEVSLDWFQSSGLPTLFVFSNPNCGPCEAMLPSVAAWQSQHEGRLRIAVLSEGERSENRKKRDAFGLRSVYLQQGREIAERYQVNGTPGAVLVDRAGLIASPPSYGEAAITALVEQTTGVASVSTGAGAAASGTAVPDVPLAQLDGAATSSTEALRGEKTLAVFWNPSCGYCQQMLPDVQALERSRRAQDPRLVVISAGSAEENRALGLRSTIVLDSSFAVGRAVGAGGTPAAVLLDEDGRVASPVVAGADAVLGLARSQPG